ncbi:extracellular matrix glycoprotein pherophorin-DZ2 [Volvox carteri f. nagariensis]|uniref:Extracellular matrix glycoprotein pherophorin-DZ2 n=1 Tax=Volvox carteri f. nagariensis TaxID=3068 RepID=D8TTQ3_VOLCA|nr:extracellular matrix glycoprotein pherophorin-DZ2 [Volvox carteri f. nagariensis]EFJ49350.1 extracellular matrix glycoprotein pherophorin-DZ2 [Volvox carteri f. nagariensis]|eukprot:XP_002949798.1 extracellular matrix glycoprotein pherophorin-DZ2 [Volvox carteri f. nagariensis]
MRHFRRQPFLPFLPPRAASADAQDFYYGDYDVALGEQTGFVPNFPYRECATRIGAYRLGPEVKSLGGGKFCFTIKVQTQNCNNACCNTDLYKIEFNVSDSCIVQPAADVKATINGVYTRVGAAFGRPVNGRNGTAVLRLTQLGLDTTSAQNAEPPAIDVRPYRYDNRTCFTIQDNIANYINGALYQNGVDMLSYFAPVAALCSDLEVRVCGTFALSADAQAFKATADGLMPYLIQQAAGGGSVCKPELEGYTVEITTEGSTCLDLSSSLACSLSPTPFPGSTCNMTQGTLPFTVSTRYSVADRKPNTTEYCFTVNTITPDQIVPSACGSGSASNGVLTTVEWYASQAMGTLVKGLNVYPAGGTKATLPVSWGPMGTNTLRVLCEGVRHQQRLLPRLPFRAIISQPAAQLMLARLYLARLLGQSM